MDTGSFTFRWTVRYWWCLFRPRLSSKRLLGRLRHRDQYRTSNSFLFYPARCHCPSNSSAVMEPADVRCFFWYRSRVIKKSGSRWGQKQKLYGRWRWCALCFAAKFDRAFWMGRSHWRSAIRRVKKPILLQCHWKLLLRFVVESQQLFKNFNMSLSAVVYVCPGSGFSSNVNLL